MDTLTIDRISQTKRGYYALFVGEEFLFSVDEETYVREGLKAGITLPVPELERLRQQSETAKAIEKALDYLTLRDHSSLELYQKLCQRYESESAAAAIAKMNELALLDDSRFALHRARYLFSQNKSRSQIRQALAQKGIHRDTIDWALEELQPHDGDDPEQQALENLIERSYRRKLTEGQVDKVVAALCRRGFAPRAVWAAVKAYCETNERDFYE